MGKSHTKKLVSKSNRKDSGLDYRGDYYSSLTAMEEIGGADNVINT